MTAQIAHAKPAKFLLTSLHDGSADVGTRVMVSLAGAAILLAFSSVLAYVLAAWFPPGWWRAGQGPYVSDEVAAVSYSFGGVLYLPLLYWIWSRHRKNRGIWIGAGLTFGVGAVTAPLCVLVEAFFRGSSEFLITGVICASASVAILLWLHVYRRYRGGRALHDEHGVINLRCPECQYRMVGLKESRCPECGREYTLDELLGRQDFEALRIGRLKALGRCEPDGPASPTGVAQGPQ